MTRREFSRATKRQAFERANGRCEKCTAKLFPGKFAYDHILPDQFGGEPVLSNCQVLCDNCHGEKTFRHDIPAIRKSDRQRDKFSGAMMRSPRPLGRGNHQHTATRPLKKRVGYFEVSK